MREDKAQKMLFEFRLRNVPWSQISIYLRCPLEYHYRVSLKSDLFSPTGLQIEEGRALHKFVEKFLSEPEINRTRSWLTEKTSSWKMQHSDSYWSHVTQTLEAILPYLTVPLLTNLAVIELEKNVSRKYKNFLLSGRIDCLGTYEGKLLLIDFKRDKHEIEHLQDYVDKYLQLTFYAYCLSLEKQIQISSVEFVNFFFLEGIYESHKASVLTIPQGLKRIDDIIHQINTTKEWPPRKTAQCVNCAVSRRDLCPLYERR